MGTNRALFEHYKYRQGRALALAERALMADLFDTVIGADVAVTLGYKVDAPIIVAHGLALFVPIKTSLSAFWGF